MDSTIHHLRPATLDSELPPSGGEDTEIARLLEELRRVDPAQAVEPATELAERLGAALGEEPA